MVSVIELDGGGVWFEIMGVMFVVVDRWMVVVVVWGVGVSFGWYGCDGWLFVGYVGCGV